MKNYNELVKELFEVINKHCGKESHFVIIGLLEKMKLDILFEAKFMNLKLKEKNK